jgi:hypothetical protein
VPAAARPDLLGAEVTDPPDVGRTVVGPDVEMGPDQPGRLAEALEEELQGRARVVVPLARELGCR